ncbi:unnamed protein product [Linum trigynum]|uniref:Uncharacterized protein n=1 Tax=Linum trigynum TaxID=586398 RepID=A0AAV2GBW1_9ROSI
MAKGGNVLLPTVMGDEDDAARKTVAPSSADLRGSKSKEVPPELMDLNEAASEGDAHPYELRQRASGSKKKLQRLAHST